MYISAANTFGEDMTLKQALKDKSENTNHIRAIKSYVDQLDKMQLSALHYQWKFYPEDDHGSVSLISEYDAFRYIFKFLEFKAFDQLFNPIKGYSLEAKKSVIDHHFDQISERYGYHVLPDERFLNDLGYGFMQNEMPKEAEAFFQMNIEHHPSSSNVYDSMGDFYRENNEKEKAIEMYRAALDRLQHPASVGKLQELLEEKE